jgi:GTPase SAR1 family protein
MRTGKTNIMSKLVVCYGLPGSGKSTFLERYRDDGFQVFDDFMKESIRHCRAFPFSRYFVDIVVALKRSEPCVIADIRLCEHAFRGDVVEILTELISNLSLEWHCFDCRTPGAISICRDNVLFRAETTKRHSEHALKSIDDFAPGYSIPDGAAIHPVIRARTAASKEHNG